MATVELKDVAKAFGAVAVLGDIDLTIGDGEFVVFVGPSGCGKSTLLRLIAGLEVPSAGTILIDGRVVNDLEPAARGIAMVFQSYALYPHMTVRENLGFALRLQRLPRTQIAAAVEHVAATLDIGHLLDRKPRHLSGGQRQRVAIGRAIVRQPRVFLFDEPLSNLDAALRQRMRYEFARLHRQLGATMVYVTHDQLEAMTLADRIVVLQGGRIEQVGTPDDLYQRPATRFVAGFIGAPRMNFLAATLVANAPAGAVVRIAGGIEIATAIDAAMAPGSTVTLGIRSEHVTLAAGANALAAPIVLLESLGGRQFAYLDLAGDEEPLIVALPERRSVGSMLEVSLPRDHLHLFDADGVALPTARRSIAA